MLVDWFRFKKPNGEWAICDGEKLPGKSAKREGGRGGLVATRILGGGVRVWDHQIDGGSKIKWLATNLRLSTRLGIFSQKDEKQRMNDKVCTRSSSPSSSPLSPPRPRDERTEGWNLNIESHLCPDSLHCTGPSPRDCVLTCAKRFQLRGYRIGDDIISTDEVKMIS